MEPRRMKRPSETTTMTPTKEGAGYHLQGGHRPPRPRQPLGPVLGPRARTRSTATASPRPGHPRLPARGAGRLGRRPDQGRARASGSPMERIHPDGFFERVFPGRREPFPYRLAVENHEGHAWEFVDPYRFGPVLTDFDLHLLGEGTHYRNYERLGAHLRDARGVPRRPLRRLGPQRRCGSASSATSTTGTAAATRCGTAAPSGIWEIFIPDLVPGRGLQVRDQEPLQRLPRRRSPTPTASPPSCGPRPRRSSGTSPSSPGTTTTGWRTAADGQGLDAPISIYEVHLGSWKRKVEEGNRFLNYRELADQLVEYLKETELHPRRADADQRAPVRRRLGLSAGRLLRPHVAVRHARRLRLLRRHAAPQRLSA